MISPQEISDKCKRLYCNAVDSWIARKSEFFPRRIRANFDLPDDHSEAICVIERLRRESKEVCKNGYRVVWKEVKSRKYGLNLQPKEIWIDSMDDLVWLAKKQKEFRHLTDSIAVVRNQLPELEEWIRRKWKDLVDVPDLRSLIVICDYLRMNPRPNCFVRELPVPVSTKLIEQHVRLLGSWLDLLLPPESIDATVGWRDFERRYGFRYFENHLLIRALDERVASQLRFPFQEISLPVHSIAKLSPHDLKVLIVENKTTLEALPTLRGFLAMGGLGFGIRQVSELDWLKSVPVYYWGDIDVQGFQILSMIRQDVAHIKSVLMDLQTLEQFRHFVVEGTASVEGVSRGLDSNEIDAYEACAAENLRLEQEKLPMASLVQRLSDAIGESLECGWTRQ